MSDSDSRGSMDEDLKAIYGSASVPQGGKIRVPWTARRVRRVLGTALLVTAAVVAFVFRTGLREFAQAIFGG